MQASPFLCEASCGWGKSPQSQLEKCGGLAGWEEGVPEPAWPQGGLGVEKTLGWARAFSASNLSVLCPSEIGRCRRELPESPPLAGQHQGKKLQCPPQPLGATHAQQRWM